MNYSMYCPNTTIYPLANFSNHDKSVFIQEFFDFLNFLRRYLRRTSSALFVHHTFVSVLIPRVPLMQCRSLHCSIAVCLDQHFHSFFSVFSIENTEFNCCSLFDAHFDAPCINKIATKAQMTSNVNVTSLTTCQDLEPYCAKIWRRY